MSPQRREEREEVRVEVEGRTLVLSSLSKVLYPRTGTTKGEVLHYYAQVAPLLLAQLAGRAVTRIRWPHGVEGTSFFEKNTPAGTPSWVRTVRVPTTGSRGGGESGTLLVPMVDDLATLTWLANLSAIELHAHQWRIGRAGRPRAADRLVVDLDPGEPAGLGQCCEVALRARDALADRGLDARPVLSGSKGLHLYAALPRPRSGEDVSALARGVAEELQAATPAEVTATMTRSRRRGKVFFDWSQNAAAKTTVSPYSVRGRERPTVAAPITWAEVAQGAEDHDAIAQLDLAAVLDRVARLGDIFSV